MAVYKVPARERDRRHTSDHSGEPAVLGAGRLESAAAGLPDRDIQRVRRRRWERQLGLCVPVLRLEPAREYLRVHSEQKDDLQVRCTRVVLCGVSGADGLSDPVLNVAARRNRERAALDRRGAVERACADDSRGSRGDIPDGRALPSGEVRTAQGKEGIEN